MVLAKKKKRNTYNQLSISCVVVIPDNQKEKIGMLETFSRLKVATTLLEAHTKGTLGSLSIEGIGKKTGISRPMLNLILREMRDAGLIVMKRRQADRREKQIELTSKFHTQIQKSYLVVGMGNLKRHDEGLTTHRLDGSLGLFRSHQKSS